MMLFFLNNHNEDTKNIIYKLPTDKDHPSFKITKNDHYPILTKT